MDLHRTLHISKEMKCTEVVYRSFNIDPRCSKILPDATHCRLAVKEAAEQTVQRRFRSDLLQVYARTSTRDSAHHRLTTLRPQLFGRFFTPFSQTTTMTKEDRQTPFDEYTAPPPRSIQTAHIFSKPPCQEDMAVGRHGVKLSLWTKKQRPSRTS